MTCCSTGPRCVSCAILESQTRPPLAPGQLWYDPLTCSFKYLSSCSGKLESLSAKPGNGLVYDATADRWNIDLAAFSGLGITDPDGKLKVITGPGIKIVDGKVSVDPEVLTELVTEIVEGLLPEPPAPVDPVKEISVKTLGTLSLLPTTPNDFILTTDTAPKGWNVGAGRMSFSADIQFNSYFANNPGGHMAIVLRQDPATAVPGSVGGLVKGQGVAIGNLVSAPEGTQTNPGIQAETWANGTAQANRLIPSTSAPTKLLDNTLYKLLVESSVGHDGRKFVRYALYRVVTTGVDIVYDTGDVLDTLAGADMTKSALLIGHVFGAGGTGWEIAITNAKVVWGPFGEKATDFSGITAVLDSRALGNIGFAVRTTAFTMPSTATRTWATVPLDFNATNPGFGSWNAAKTEFTFSKAGAYMVNVTGPIGTFFNASAAGGQVSTSAYLDLGTYQHWVGSSSAAVAAGNDRTESAFAGASVPVVAAVGQKIKLVLTTISTGATNAFGVFGVAEGVEGGASAASGISITPI